MRLRKSSKIIFVQGFHHGKEYAFSLSENRVYVNRNSNTSNTSVLGLQIYQKHQQKMVLS